jgi:hypothetical protein
MKAVFSSYLSKFNLPIAGFTLGISILSLPVSAAPKEACVKTESGDVVCGQLVPKPASNTPTRVDNDETMQTQTRGRVTWDLKSCVRKQKNVRCTFSLIPTTQDAGGYAIYLTRTITKLVDSAGNEYFANRIQIASKTAGANGDVQLDLTKGARYNTTIDFTGVPPSISQVISMKIHTGDGILDFREVPIK